jgi:hypothetical protein
MAAVLSTPQRNFLDMVSILEPPIEPPGRRSGSNGANVVGEVKKITVQFEIYCLSFSQP